MFSILNLFLFQVGQTSDGHDDIIRCLYRSEDIAEIIDKATVPILILYIRIFINKIYSKIKLKTNESSLVRFVLNPFLSEWSLCFTVIV